MKAFGRYVRRHHVGLLALFIALGGTSYAALKLPANSVGAKQIKANAVTSSEVKNRSLRLADFAAGQIPPGPAGPAGPAGPQGPSGAKGDTGPSFVPTVRPIEAASAEDASDEKGAQASCRQDEVAVGGYYITPMGSGRPKIAVDFDVAPNPYTWLVTAREVGINEIPWQLHVKVWCVG